MELSIETFAAKLLGDFVHPFGDDQGRPLRPLGEKIPHGTPDRTCHPNRLARLLADRKLAANPTNGLDISLMDRPTSLLHRGPE